MSETFSVRFEGGMRTNRGTEPPSMSVVVKCPVSGARICEIEIPGPSLLNLLANTISSEGPPGKMEFWGTDNIGKWYQVITLSVPISDGYGDAVLQRGLEMPIKALTLFGFKIHDHDKNWNGHRASKVTGQNRYSIHANRYVEPGTSLNETLAQLQPLLDQIDVGVIGSYCEHDG